MNKKSLLRNDDQVGTINAQRPCFTLWNLGDDCDGKILFVGNRLASFGVDINFESPLYLPDYIKVAAICGLAYPYGCVPEIPMFAYCVFDSIDTPNLDINNIKTTMSRFTYYGYHNGKNRFLGEKMESHPDTKHDCDLQFRKCLDNFINEVGEPERILQVYTNLYWHQILRTVYFEREEKIRLASFTSISNILLDKDSKKIDFDHYLLTKSYMQSSHVVIPPSIPDDVLSSPVSVKIHDNPIKLRRTKECVEKLDKKSRIAISQNYGIENLLDLKIIEKSGMHRKTMNKNTFYKCNICKCRINAQVPLINLSDPLNRLIDSVQINNVFYREKTFDRLISILQDGHLIHDIFTGMMIYDMYVMKLKDNNHIPIDILDFFFSQEGMNVSSKYWSFCSDVITTNSKNRIFSTSCAVFYSIGVLTNNDLVLFSVNNNEFVKLAIEAFEILKNKDPIEFIFRENMVICDHITRFKKFRSDLLPKILIKVRDTQTFSNVMRSNQTPPWKTLDNLKGGLKYDTLYI